MRAVGESGGAGCGEHRDCRAGAVVDRYDELEGLPPLNPDHHDPGDAVRAWRARIGAADAVVIASPEYAGSLAGVVKNALDWIVGSGELYR